MLEITSFVTTFYLMKKSFNVDLKRAKGIYRFSNSFMEFVSKFEKAM